MNDRIEHKLKGRFSVDLIDKETGEIVESYEDNNLIVDLAGQAIVNCVSGGLQSDWAINNVWIGDDVGTGDKFTPQAPQPDYTSANIDLIYQTPTLNVAYPTPVSVMFNITIDGNVIVDASNTKYGLTGDTADITSTALMTGNGSVFAYKRFPVKVITRFVNLLIRWTIEY